MAISPVLPSGKGCSWASMTRASQPEALPTAPSLRAWRSKGLENEGATVSVRPMVSITPMPKRCSKACKCAGGSAAEALRQKPMPRKASGAGASPSSR